ncbi:MAG: cytochrome c-type biogenesis protein CcmH [Nitrospirae bacterium]|nr:cytochrome c-type biogenesis protein CcmH [Nitrospirota bacterium]MBI3353152.1 cytochrome c-type biogenesis protein CcmH [Nitrospirota bacterium]
MIKTLPGFRNKMSSILFFTCALILASAAFGAESLNEDALQAQTKKIAKTLRCMVCQSESVWESNAELAIQMREIIRERLMEGQTPDQIRSYFVGRYGDPILLKPRTFGLNWLLWGGPFLLLFIGGVFLYRNIRKWVSQTALSPPEESPAMSEQERQRIQQELNSFKN